MLRNLQIQCFLFLIVFNLFLLETNEKRVRIQAAASSCDKPSGWLLASRSGSLQLDSDHDGNAYLLSKNGGDHQAWELIRDNHFYKLKNVLLQIFTLIVIIEVIFILIMLMTVIFKNGE